MDESIGNENQAEWSAEKFKAIQDRIKFISTMEVDYVPQTLEEAHLYLDKFLQDKKVFRNSAEEDATAGSHHTLGRWIRNKWWFWWNKETLRECAHNNPDYPREMPVLVKYFKDLGVFHPDDMSGLVILSYHRKLNGRPFDLDTEVQKIKAFYKEGGDEGMSNN